MTMFFFQINEFATPAIIGSQTITAAATGADTATLPTKASVETAVNKIQVALDLLLAVSTTTC